MTIQVFENDDNTLTISWDENDPQESILNTWTEEDFIRCIETRLLQIENSDSTGEELKKYYIDQTEEEVLEDLRKIQEYLEK